MIALVGESGAGKSTLADLVPRFYDVTEGSILLDATDLRDFKIDDLRSLMAVVSQEAILFNDTVLNNIGFGDTTINREAAIEAAKAANAHHFISELEQGYDTPIGDRGMRLSGGQRQRLTIARAIYKNAPILIMDEATSALDTESERLVQDAIDKMMENRTSIVIAHRLSTIRHADEIIVLQKGEIVEKGTHEELIKKQGYYYRLVQMQEVK
jgi:subfamily B ATP-binding cassette protein MsbA